MENYDNYKAREALCEKQISRMKLIYDRSDEVFYKLMAVIDQRASDEVKWELTEMWEEYDSLSRRHTAEYALFNDHITTLKHENGEFDDFPKLDPSFKFFENLGNNLTMLLFFFLDAKSITTLAWCNKRMK